MTKVEVRVVQQGRGYRLDLYHEGVFIGEYERNRASEESGDLAAKVREAEGASDFLIEARERTTNGKITVRWNDETRQKEIRTYVEGRPIRGEVNPPSPRYPNGSGGSRKCAAQVRGNHGDLKGEVTADAPGGRGSADEQQGRGDAGEASTAPVLA